MRIICCNRISAVCIVKLLFISIFLIFNKPGYSQSPLKLYTTITEEKWLPANSVRIIFQDSKGFIWVGTNSGLFKYNLHTATNFNLTQKSSGRLLNNTIHAIAEDSYGNILVGTESGLGVINPDTGECTIMSSTDETITKIIAGKNNLFWITTANGSVYRIIAQPFGHYKSDLKPFVTVREQGNAIEATTIFEMPDGTVLIGTVNGIFKLDITKQMAVPTSFKRSVTKIFSYDYLHLYVGTQQAGLYVLNFSDKNRDTFTTQRVKFDEGNGKDGYIVDVSGINKQYIITATRDDIFAAETGSGQHSFKKISPAPLHGMAGAITYLYIDRTANIWLGSTRGLFKIKRQSLLSNYFETGAASGNVVTGILNDGRGKLWIATSANGLQLYHPERSILQKLNLPYKINIVRKASNGSVVAVADRSIIQLSDETGDSRPRVKHLATTEPDLQDMLEVSPGEWWLASWGNGLTRYLEKGKEDSLEVFRKLKNQMGTEVHVFCLLKDSRQHVWIGTRGKGIYRVDLATNEIKHYYKDGKELNRSNRILCIYEDSKKRIWIGTRGDGLLLYTPETDKFQSYGLNNGLPSNSICSVQENSFGEIWISTLNGIARYKPEFKIEFQSFNVEDGMGSSEFNFNIGAAGDSGEVYFANGSGFYSFRKSNNPGNIIFPAVITNFEVHSTGKSTAGSADRAKLNNRLLLEIISKGRIILDHFQNSFEISFSALDFTNPEKNRYLYRLVGLDSTWKFIQGAKATVPIYDLPAGEYVFELFSSNSQGEWNEKPVTVNIVIKPYFWLSTPAYIIYTLLVLGAIGGAWYSWRNWYNLRKEFQKEREFAQKQSQQMVLYTDLSHEIKNRLSLILGPLELALSDKRVNQVFLNNLYNQAQRLKRLTDQILNIRKTDSGNFILNVSEENIERLIERLYSESQPLAKIKDVDFTFRRMKESIIGWCDEELLEIITLNLLGNAIKYVNVAGKVEIKADTQYLGGDDRSSKTGNEGNYLILSIFNTGEGIPSEEVNKVTQLFYRSANAQGNTYGGAGVGLNLVARLVHLHHGFMEILSEAGESTTVTIQLPIDKFNYSISELKPNMITSPIIVPREQTIERELFISEKHKGDSTYQPRKRKILVVDDKPELALLVKECLQSEFDVYMVYDAKKALEVLDAMRIELIISDLVMPEIDGLTLCLTVRSNPELKDIPFVILTGRNSEEQKLICFRNGVNDFIEKPFSAELLKWKVKSILKPLREIDPAQKNIVIITPGTELTESPEEAFIQKIVNTIEENLDKDFLDADFLAEKSFMSRATFYRKMESLVGESPSIFIRKYRLKKSAKLLLSGHYNVSAVAQKVGFKDPKYFSKCFQKEFGMSPSEYLEKEDLIKRVDEIKQK
ncbi:MAG TPA: two-component regulator propeller domain-containing protein [Sphingobacteriaceae bacterium]